VEASTGRAKKFEAEGLGKIEELRWQQHGERAIYDNPWVRLTLDVTPPNGERFEHHVVRLQKLVMTVVIDDDDDDDDRVLLLWRHRFRLTRGAGNSREELPGPAKRTR
jgi:hypothetical protein